MTALAAILVRLVVISLGFAASCLAASAFLHVVWLGPFTGGEGLAELFHVGSMWITVPLFAAMVGYFSFFQALIVVAIGEFTDRRGWLYYAIGGALATLPIMGVLWVGISDRDAALEYITATILAAGMAGGMCYWLVAGRSAGLWRQGSDDRAATQPFDRKALPRTHG